MNASVTRDDVRLNFDPAAPAKRFADAGIEAARMSAESLLPRSVPWPSGLQPVPQPLNPAPQQTDDLSRFSGYDAIVMTWTSAEASALAELMTPGYPISQWYEYRHNVAAYIPLVTGSKAPFNDPASENKRYYQSLGLYFPIQIGTSKILLFKSGLHMDYDGPAIPISKLVAELAQVVGPSIFITTGTGGGIGSNVKLGDVVIAASARFDCTTQFADNTQFPFNNAQIPTSPLPPNSVSAITPALTSVNASRLPAGSQNPTIWSSPSDNVVTTDFFGFDDSTDYYKLQGLGRVCDMGDAMVGYTLKDVPNLNWYSVRNASDPQIPNPNDDIAAASKQAENIYTRYGAITTAASVIATWAIIVSAFTQ